MNSYAFGNILRQKVKEENIMVALSLKILKFQENEENEEDNKGNKGDERICYIVSNISVDICRELVSSINPHKNIFELIDKYSFNANYNFQFGFSRDSTKFYIEKYSDIYIIESFEWLNDKPSELTYRVYNKCDPTTAIKKFGKQRILDFSTTKIRSSIEGKDIQNYIKFKTNDEEILMVPINIDNVAFIMQHCNNKYLRKWLFKNSSMKFAWLQWSESSFTIYIRDR